MRADALEQRGVPAGVEHRADVGERRADARLLRAVDEVARHRDPEPDAEAVAQGDVAGTAEYVEGMTAFLEKRAPRFRA